jgi:hypothetical protein
MDYYVVQKAQQALEALTTDQPLESRLTEAAMHLSFTTGSVYMITMPSEVRKPYLDYQRVTERQEPLPNQAEHLRDLLEEIFRAAGRGPVRVETAGVA